MMSRSDQDLSTVEKRPFRLHLLAKNQVCLAASSIEDSLAVVRIAHEWWGPESRLQMNSPKLWFIALSLRGTIMLDGCAAAGTCGPGNLLVCSPHDHCRIAVTSLPCWEAMVISGNGYGLRDLIRRHLGLDSQIVRLENAHRIEQILTSALDAAGDGGPFAQDICDDYLRILIASAHQGSIGHGPRAGPSLKSFAKAKSYIDRNFETLKGSGDAAEACGLHRASLSRLFRIHALDSPSAYLQRLKMNHAAHLLTTTTASLQSIARQLGYSDAFSFSKAFRRRFGLSPSFYRQGRD